MRALSCRVYWPSPLCDITLVFTPLYGPQDRVAQLPPSCLRVCARLAPALPTCGDVGVSARPDLVTSPETRIRLHLLVASIPFAPVGRMYPVTLVGPCPIPFMLHPSLVFDRSSPSAVTRPGLVFCAPDVLEVVLWNRQSRWSSGSTPWLCQFFPPIVCSQATSFSLIVRYVYS